MTLQHNRLWRWLRWVLLGLILLLWARTLYTQWPTLHALSWRVRWGWWILALGALVAQMMLLGTGWWWILDNVGVPLSWRAGAGIWLRAQIARYLPGGFWDIAARAALGKAHAVAIRSASTAAVIEAWFQVATAGTFLLFSVLLFPGPPLTPYLPWIALGLGTLIVFLLSSLLPVGLNLLLRRWHRPGPTLRFSWPDRLLLFGIYSLAHLLQGLGFLLFVWGLDVEGTTPLTGRFIPLLISAYIGAWLVGYIAVFAPTGIGVREGALVLLLGPHLSLSVAIPAALGYRVWQTLRDALMALVGWYLGRAEGR